MINVLKYTVRLLLWAGLLFLRPLGAFAETAYDASPKTVTGSARTVALGGAVVADPDGYEAVFVNPAGLSGMAGTGFDFGSDGNSVDNFVVDLNDPRARSLNVPIKYSYYGLRLVYDRWGVGFAAQTPFSFDDEFNGTSRLVRRGRSQTVANNDIHKISNTANTYTAAAATRLLDGSLAVGLSFDYTRVSERYEFKPVVSPSSTAATREQYADAVSANVGLLWEPRKWVRAGLVYKSGYRAGFASSLNAGVPNQLAPFRDIKTPDRLTAGLRFAPRDDFRIFLQGRLTHGMAGTTIIGSGLFPAAPGASVESGRRDTLEGSWGLEYVVYDVDDLTAKVWGGGYLEDANIQGGYSRYHRTGGFTFQPWFISLSMAVDDAELYNNFVVGIGVDLLKAATVVSKHYGWKLPL